VVDSITHDVDAFMAAADKMAGFITPCEYHQKLFNGMTMPKDGLLPKKKLEIEARKERDVMFFFISK
jgi:hypothetical protein